MPPDVVHYLRHAVKRQQWPPGTTLEEYVESLRALAHDPARGVVVSRYQDFGWQLAVARRSALLRGPAGSAWVMVEYRVRIGHWVTGYQFEEDPDWAGRGRNGFGNQRAE